VNVECFMIPNNVARRQHCKHKSLRSEYPKVRNCGADERQYAAKLAIKWPLVKDDICIARPVVDVIE
jgi:hypothetical protein